MTNGEIVDYYMNSDNGGNLPRKCVEYQFLKLARNEPWKMQYMEDFYDDLIVYLLTYDNEKLNNAHENHHMNALITRIIQNQIYSSSSKFYHNYLRFDRSTTDLWDEDIMTDDE